MSYVCAYSSVQLDKRRVEKEFTSLMRVITCAQSGADIGADPGRIQGRVQGRIQGRIQGGRTRGMHPWPPAMGAESSQAYPVGPRGEPGRQTHSCAFQFKMSAFCCG